MSKSSVPEPISDALKATLAKPLGKIPSGVYILTAAHAGLRTAMLASWVQQAAFAPPALSIAIVRDRPIFPLIQQSNRLAISIIPADDKTLMKKYARGVDPSTAFDAVATQSAPSGLPVLSDALAYLDCQLLTTCEFGADHLLLVAQVTHAAILKDATPFVHLRGSGFHY